MSDTNYESQYIELLAKHEDLQLRFDQMAPLILDLQKKLDDAVNDLKVSIAARDKYKKGFEAQSRMHQEAVKERKSMDVESIPAGATAQV